MTAAATCSSSGCPNAPTRRGFWPGRQPQPFCPACAERATNIAKVMGFTLVTEALAPSPSSTTTKEEVIAELYGRYGEGGATLKEVLGAAYSLGEEAAAARFLAMTLDLVAQTEKLLERVATLEEQAAAFESKAGVQ